MLPNIKHHKGHSRHVEENIWEFFIEISLYRVNDKFLPVLEIKVVNFFSLVVFSPDARVSNVYIK